MLPGGGLRVHADGRRPREYSVHRPGDTGGAHVQPAKKVFLTLFNGPKEVFFTLLMCQKVDLNIFVNLSFDVYLGLK